MKEDSCLECEARLLNINYGHNRELMEKCRRLEEYAIFVARVRKYIRENVSKRKAITLAMDECIQEGILYDILTKQKAEVLGVVLSTFNKELYEKNLKEDAYNAGRYDGLKKGREEGIAEGAHEKLCQLVKIKLSKGQTAEQIADALEENIETVQEIMKELA